ncbi:hypothetical protein HNQ51_003108 [Inhella inkyongensis]|uniref:Uncharacterized protein n=1 Tax=Inhella inkyongensis TaxID=392593 RepID=A0A840SBD6_9BURK|nr:hypothetical protein [Inhella inkyongensis]MBB5205781.1 hypothetical protein [Inhella inkyongensis]
MKPDLNASLGAALNAVPTPPAPPALVLGAAGWLGSALLAQVLGAGHRRVGAWMRRPMGSTLRGLVPVLDADLEPAQEQPSAWAGACAYLVLERAGLTGAARNAVFAQPDASELLPLAQRLRALGVTRLLVVLPHAPGSLPEGLRHGFADRDEQGLSELGFTQLVLVRSSRDTQALPSGTPWLERFAAAWWSQLRWMLPDDERPLRSVALARVVVQAERLLREAGPGVRVLTQAQASRAAQSGVQGAQTLRVWAGLDAQPV